MGRIAGLTLARSACTFLLFAHRLWPLPLSSLKQLLNVRVNLIDKLWCDQAKWVGTHSSFVLILFWVSLKWLYLWNRMLNFYRDFSVILLWCWGIQWNDVSFFSSSDSFCLIASQLHKFNKKNYHPESKHYQPHSWCFLFLQNVSFSLCPRWASEKGNGSHRIVS